MSGLAPARTRLRGRMSDGLIIQVEFLRLDAEAQMPVKAYETDAGFDLPCTERQWIPPGATMDVSTGFAIGMPPGWWGRIVGRSSTMRSRGLLVIEGVIDAGFRGELFTCVHNPTDKPIYVDPGDRLAQLLFLPVPAVHWHEVKQLSESERGVNGFGSSGR